MAHNYLVDLAEEEQGYLLDVIHQGKPTVRKVTRAHVLLGWRRAPLMMKRLRQSSIWEFPPCVAPASGWSTKG